MSENQEQAISLLLKLHNNIVVSRLISCHCIMPLSSVSALEKLFSADPEFSSFVDMYEYIYMYINSYV